jgi:hypothetical protein
MHPQFKGQSWTLATSGLASFKPAGRLQQQIVQRQPHLRVRQRQLQPICWLHHLPVPLNVPLHLRVGWTMKWTSNGKDVCLAQAQKSDLNSSVN